MLKRRQLIELHDMDWWPDLIREAEVEVLNLANRYTGFARALLPAFSSALRETGARTVLDLCSGAGGPVTLLLEELARPGREQEGEGERVLPHVILTDLYPNVDPWRKLVERWPGLLRFVDRPVDATDIPADLEGDLVTVVNALHHFPPEMVEGMITEVVRRGSALFIAEAFPRDPLRATAYWPALVLAAAVNPFVCDRRRMGKALATFVVPVVMVAGVWDWVVSVLRIHRPEDLVEMGRAIAPHYDWSHGEAAFPPWGRAIFVFGRPRELRCSRSD